MTIPNFTLMKHNFLIILMLLILTGCQSGSYFAAQQTNHKRFDGWNRQDAEFLMKTHDQVQLANALSEVAEAKANLRITYVLTKDIQEEMEDLFLKFKLEAGVKRIKLASSLSDKSDEFVQKLNAIVSDNFDAVYYQYLTQSLEEINALAEEYLKEGHTPRLKEFARELRKETEPLLDRTEKSDLS